MLTCIAGGMPEKAPAIGERLVCLAKTRDSEPYSKYFLFQDSKKVVF
jgi:hypothetical protein